MNRYRDTETGKIYTESALYAEWANQAEDEADIETSFEDWLFLNQWQNGGTLEQIPGSSLKTITELLLIIMAMLVTLFLAFAMFIGAVIQTSERLYPEPITAAEPEDNKCVVIGYEQIQLSPNYTEDYAIAVDSLGNEHKLTISDAVIGDEFIIRHGEVIEKTYEGCQDQNDDYYIIELENGDLYEITADDLWPGDDVTVYFYKERPIRTLYGWR